MLFYAKRVQSFNRILSQDEDKNFDINIPAEFFGELIDGCVVWS
jgi:hypothetical protein